jgi:predicted GH43/DUF377 family glycosyl hydrolase
MPKADGIFTRYKGNPILTADDWPYSANAVFNAGATRLADGSTLLLCRVEDHRGHSHLTAARSHNGLDQWQIDPQPTMAPDLPGHPEEVWGVEDPRVVWVPTLDRFCITYTAYSHGGPCVAVALTQDFKTFERYGVVMPPEDKDAALFPHKVGDNFAMLHRPMARWGGAHIWVSYSPDLRHWGSHKILLAARRGAWWDANKIGLSTPLIETKEGWLMLYHGVRTTASGSLYRWGLALLDLATPEKCLLRGNEWVFGPHADYERVGDVGGVAFPCGYTIDDDGDSINVYYGGADTCVALATSRISTMLEWIKSHGSSECVQDYL